MSNDKNMIFEDEIEAAKANEKMIAEDELQNVPVMHETHNVSQTETEVHFIGDRTIIAQTVQLLSYIRHAIRNNVDGKLVLYFGNEIANANINFDVNGCEIPDLVLPDQFRIN